MVNDYESLVVVWRVGRINNQTKYAPASANFSLPSSTTLAKKPFAPGGNVRRNIAAPPATRETFCQSQPERALPG